jgi:hypothetical protein
MSVGRLTRYSPGGGTCDLGPAYKNPGPQGPQGPIGPPGLPGGVLQIIGGTGITISPPGGTGIVTVSWLDPGYSTIPGLTGSQGPTGPASTVAGPQGIQGPTGPQGIQGPTGPAGTGGGGGAVSQIVAGTNVTISPTNGLGVVTINSTGIAGPTGPQGIQGLIGPTGPGGTNAVTQIVAGTNVTISPTNGLGVVTVNSTPIAGPQGPQGIQGPQGSAGAQGAQGVQGAQGSAGVQGPAGPQGSTGPQGNVGAQGSQGPQGIQGATGPAGGVTQIVAGTNVTISPTNGLGAVTINSSGGGGGYVIKIIYSGTNLPAFSGTAVFLKDPSGTSLDYTTWSFNRTSNASFTIQPPVGLRGKLDGFNTFAQTAASSYLFSSFTAAATSGYANVKYDGSSTYTFSGLDPSSTSIMSGGILYITFNASTYNIFY